VTRCWCGHTEDTHRHYREGSDCGACGAGECIVYAPRSLSCPVTHHLAAARSDAHFWSNYAALVPFASTSARIARATIPGQREVRTIAGELEARRIRKRAQYRR
jgi:hypothetical protein